ncbi:substrate-binding domain-containing protein [Actinoplanes sp. NPDC023936]|uniref:substrate-binding domain-containing protein n=1 Tax=Actinoplanes sp. NPDC023936 TaxID=3154910 RepID=UPI0033CAB24A
MTLSPVAAATADDVLRTTLLWSLAGALAVALLALVLLLLRRQRRARLRRVRATDNHDDPFRTGGLPVLAARGRRRPRLSRLRVRPRTAAVAAVLLLVTAGTALWWGGDTDTGTPAVPAAAVACPDARLRVAAAPEIAPVVQEAARTLDPDGGECGPVVVTAEEPAVTAETTQRPDVWIPSSSAWLRIAAADGAAYTAEGDPLAHSPIVLAGPEKAAEDYARDGKTSWAAVADGAVQQRITISAPDPLRTTVGLLSVHAIYTAMNRTTPDTGIAKLRALTLRSRLADAAADPAALLQRASTGTDVGVFPVIEQQLQAYQDGEHTIPLVGAVPSDGLVEADYPYAISPAVTDRDLAARLRQAISAEALTAAGFRAQAQTGILPLPDRPDDMLTEAVHWSQYRTMDFQVLVLVDASGSMNEPVTDKAGRKTTKAALLRETGLNASRLFGTDTSVGMWLFSTPSPTSPAHVETVGLGPLTERVGNRTRRELLAAGISGYRAAENAGTPLYRTVLDASAAMRAQAKPETSTLVVVLTDGKDAGSRFAMSGQAFRKQLETTRDPQRPVPIIAVGYGADADMAALTAMAKATGGTALSANDPADVASAIAKAFLAAHAPS